MGWRSIRLTCATSFAHGFGRKCKWGRHRCRPHSHRRVGVLPCDPCGKPLVSLFRDTLGARCLDPGDQSCDRSHQGFVTGARTGIRFSLLPCNFVRCRSIIRNCHAQSLDRGHVPLPIPHHRNFGLSRHNCSTVSAKYPTRPVSLRHTHVSKATCIRPKPPPCRLSMSVWTDVTAILGIRTLGTSTPCGVLFRLVCFPKTS